MKNRLYEILFPGQNPSTASKACNRLIVVLIFLNVIIMIAETFSLPPAATKAMQIFEVVSLALFTIEYLLRLYMTSSGRRTKNSSVPTAVKKSATKKKDLRRAEPWEDPSFIQSAEHSAPLISV